MAYTVDAVKAAVEANRERLLASYVAGRPETWRCDRRTGDFLAISGWLNEELARVGIDDLGRRTQTNQFNRFSRSIDDLWTLATRIMNDALVDNIDRTRVPHKRWG